MLIAPDWFETIDIEMQKKSSKAIVAKLQEIN